MINTCINVVTYHSDVEYSLFLGILKIHSNLSLNDLDHEFIMQTFGKAVLKYEIDDDNKMNISNYITSKMSN